MSEGSDFPFSLTGEARATAIARVQAVAADWGLTLPDFDPLVLDFGLGRFTEVGEVEYWIANEEGAGYCGKFLFVDDGQTCPYHHHEIKHETFYIVKGTVRMVIDGTERRLAQGDTLVMPPGTHHAFTGVGPALLLEVSMPSTRGDSYFVDTSIGEDGVI